MSTRMVAGRYQLGKLLGEGGMGAVYEAEHVELGVKVAVKLLSYAIASDPRSIARFRREARATATIKHDNIVQVTDAGADEHGPFIVMERLRGESVSSLLHREHVLDWHVAVEIALQITAGLCAAHAHNIIHRDLKPANVLIVRDEGTMRVKILDFGISKLIHDETPAVTTTGQVLGTPRYMAPEQARGEVDIDGRADLYAVGAMLYLMVTGRVPHTATTREEVIAQVLEGKIVPPRQHRPDLPEELEQVILKALALDPDDRHADGRELIAALRVAAGKEITATATAPVPARRPRVPVLGVVIGVAAAAALAAGGWIAFGRDAATMTGPPLRLGITRYTADEVIRQELAPITSYLGERLGRKVDVVLIDYGQDPGAKLLTGEVDVASLAPYVYVRTKALLPDLRILAAPIGRHGGASYEGVIIARADSGIRALEDLRGRVFCYVEKTSASGYLYPRALIRRRGIDPDHFFSSVRFKGTHSEAVAALSSLECDGAAVFSAMVEDTAREPTTSTRFVTLEATPRIPYDAYCVTSRLPREVADKLEEAFLAISPGSERARLLFHGGGSYSGFGRATDSDYDRVRAIQIFLGEETVAPK